MTITVVTYCGKGINIVRIYCIASYRYKRRNIFARNINKLKSIGPNSTKTSIIDITSLVVTISISLLLFIQMNQLWQFPSIYFYSFWMEKKMILLSRICSVEYMGLVLSLRSLESNSNTSCTKNRPFWSSSYLVTSIILSIIVGGIAFFYFFSFLFVRVIGAEELSSKKIEFSLLHPLFLYTSSLPLYYGDTTHVIF